MVERRPALGLLAHAIMIIGALLVAFPIYLAFVASTHSAQEVMQSPLPLWPGSHFWESYQTALMGTGKARSHEPPAALIIRTKLPKSMNLSPTASLATNRTPASRSICYT